MALVCNDNDGKKSGGKTSVNIYYAQLTEIVRAVQFAPEIS
jgi:hypothetical protein